MSDPFADLVRGEAAAAPPWLAERAPPRCIVCGNSSVYIGLFVPDNPVRHRALVYSLCNEHLELPLVELERWIRNAVRRGGEDHLLPEGFGR